MSELKATPGPWKVYRTSNGALLGIGDADAGGVTDYLGGFWRSGAEKVANVHLVAAAPELYAALDELVATLRREAPGTPLNNHRFDALGMKAHAALAKARGQS